MFSVCVGGEVDVLCVCGGGGRCSLCGGEGGRCSLSLCVCGGGVDVLCVCVWRGG